VQDEYPADEGWWRADAVLGRLTTVEITDLKFGRIPALPYGTTRAVRSFQFSDPKLGECLNAQIAQLLMSLVGEETRPGDPLNYPLAWLRDGAYVVVALARAGQVDVAKRLCGFFAEHDFFGGFGSEADAPGLSLWALGETSKVAHDPAFDAHIWQAVRRKAEMIVRMRHSSTEIRAPWFGPIVPSHQRDRDLDLVCGAAKDGLITGRMDFYRPLLFVNAVSYLGLREAADLADRMDAATQAASWRQESAAVKSAWNAALATKEAQNDRTFISALWPSEIGLESQVKLRELMEPRWKANRTPTGGFSKVPLWTYFDIAEAHNWLQLGDRHKADQTVSWFIDHQSVPGLYTWWEGKGEENSFHRWNDIRGWVDPPNVTPHYWTAAEMALLLMDVGAA
jgi:hypothetical protein